MYTNILIKLIVIVGFVVNLNVIAKSLPAPLIDKVYEGGIHFEGPYWSGDENSLYWVDISAQSVFRLNVDSGNVTRRDIGYGPVSLVVGVKDNPRVVVVTVRSEVYMMAWDGPEGDSALSLLSAVDLGLPENRCNDGKVDAKGRLWFGTMGKEENNVVEEDQASLYMMDSDNQLNPDVKIRPVSVSNGIAWTSDSKFMFYIDTPTRNIDFFEFDLATGSIRNRKTLFSFQANNVTGLPDGMTIDTDGNLWVACFNGGKVIKIDSRAGKLMEQHNLPASKVTSVMFGGHDLSTLFVTTSKRGLSPGELSQQPDAGSLFAIRGTGSVGLPQNQFVLPNADKYIKL